MDPPRQAKLAKLESTFLETTVERSPNVRITIVRVPRIGVQPVVRVIPTNVGNVRLNLRVRLRQPSLTAVPPISVGSLLNCILPKFDKGKRNALVVSSIFSLARSRSVYINATLAVEDSRGGRHSAYLQCDHCPTSLV